MPCSALVLACFKVSVLFFLLNVFSLQFQFGMLESPENQDLILKT